MRHSRTLGFFGLATSSLLAVACANEIVDPATESVDGLVDASKAIAPDLNAGSKNKLGELSGMVASTRYPGIVWAHATASQKIAPLESSSMR